jgi:hypothetical protein
MSSSNEFRKFLTVTVAATVIGALAAVALVVVVDPYGLYGVVDKAGFNKVKPQLSRYQKEIKTASAAASGARHFIVGNSRAEIGFNPQHPAIADGARPAYNLAMAGHALGSAREQLVQLAAKGQTPAKLVVGVDFMDFPLDPRVAQPAAAAISLPSTWSRLQWQFDTLFSIDSVFDALSTVRLQRTQYPVSMTREGFNPFIEYQKYARDDGYYPLFQQRAMENAKRFKKMPRGLVDPATGSSEDFDSLRAIVADAAAGNAEVHIAIYPYHAQLLAMYEAAGLMPLFDQWKALLVQHVEEVRAAHPGARITLWDFSGYSPYQCELIPARGDKAGKTRWYWEAGHFKAELGDLVLSRMLGGAAAGSTDPGFGTILTSASLDENRQRMQRERAACMESYPALFSDAAELIGATR